MDCELCIYIYVYVKTYLHILIYIYIIYYIYTYVYKNNHVIQKQNVQRHLATMVSSPLRRLNYTELTQPVPCQVAERRGDGARRDHLLKAVADVSGTTRSSGKTKTYADANRDIKSTSMQYRHITNCASCKTSSNEYIYIYI